MRKSNIFFLILFLAYLGLVAYCCFGHFDNMPNVSNTLFGIPIDKVVHFCMFFPFPILCFLTFDQHSRKVWKSVLSVIAILMVGFALAAGTEIGQSFTTYRSCDIKDFYADGLSLSISAAIILIIDIIRISIRNHNNYE